MGPQASLILVFLGVLILLYIAYWFRLMDRSDPRVRSCEYQRDPSFWLEKGGPCFRRPQPQWAEYFDEDASTSNNVDADAVPRPLPQSFIDFSDIMVTDESKAAAKQLDDDKNGMQTIDDRFQAAKRKVVECRMKNGVYSNKQRRKLVENLLRRPPCGRRVRSWRTENSDYIRGDVRPKGSGDSSNLVRSAKNNPQIDLHPGSLGPMAGLEGQWLSVENLSGNIFQDVEGTVV